MKEKVLVGRGRQIVEVPWEEWKKPLSTAPEVSAKLLSFMTEEHHAVRNYLVTELPRRQSPISRFEISEALTIPPVQLAKILDDLEKNLFFLVRDARGDVEWAFPVTAASTGHSLVFSSGDRIDAA